MLSSTLPTRGFLGLSLLTGLSFEGALVEIDFFDTATDLLPPTLADFTVLPIERNDEVSEMSSPASIAEEKIERHPSAPPTDEIKSITSTRPTTVPSSSTTGRFKNLLSCIVCNASITSMSGSTESGEGVIKEDTAVSSKGISFDTARFITSLNVKIPTNASSSTTKAAFLASAISIAVSRMFVPGPTFTAFLPLRTFLKVGTPPSPPAPSATFASRGPSS